MTICAEAFGDPADPPLLLVMGLGMQMIRWHESLIAELTAAGLYVVRFDNRDSGRSTCFPEIPAPTPVQLLRRRFDPRQYTLSDADARHRRAPLDALGLDRVHVAGASMGGMIAQTLAAEHPRRARSHDLDHVEPEAAAGRPAGAARTYPILLRRPARDLDDYLAQQVAVHAAIGSPATRPTTRSSSTSPAAATRATPTRAAPAGSWRRCSPPATAPARCGGSRAPTLSDPRRRRSHDLALSGGRATARAIPAPTST